MSVGVASLKPAGKTCLTKLAAHRTKDCVKLRKRLDLMTESAGPKRLQPLLFFENAIFKAGDVLLSESKLFCGRPNQLRKVHTGLECEEPEIIEIPRFIQRLIGKSDDLLDRDFVQTVDRDRTVFLKVF